MLSGTNIKLKAEGNRLTPNKNEMIDNCNQKVKFLTRLNKAADSIKICIFTKQASA